MPIVRRECPRIDGLTCCATVACRPRSERLGPDSGAVKPEILMPGGRLMYHAPLVMQNGVGRFEPQLPNQHPPGQLVASPGITPMELNRAAYSCGTSNATALASRTAAITLSRLRELLQDYDGLSLRTTRSLPF